MIQLSAAEKQHLFKALRTNNPKIKNYHIRQTLQMRGVVDLPEDIEVDPAIEDIE